MFSRSLNNKCEVHVSSERTTKREILIELQYTEQSSRWAAPARRRPRPAPRPLPDWREGTGSGIHGPGRGLAHSPNTLVFPPLRACSPSTSRVRILTILCFTSASSPLTRTGAHKGWGGVSCLPLPLHCWG